MFVHDPLPGADEEAASRAAHTVAEELRGLLATHGDWDHLLGRLAFPGVALGVAESTAARLRAEPGAAQRELRDFDEGLYIDRPRPLALGSLQALPVPGRCELGEQELELHPAEGHTPDGMAVMIPRAKVCGVGDYLSPLEIPTFDDGGDLGMYLATLERLRPLVEATEHVVPGHGPILDNARALTVLDEDIAYLGAGPRPIDACTLGTSRVAPSPAIQRQSADRCGRRRRAAGPARRSRGRMVSGDSWHAGARACRWRSRRTRMSGPLQGRILRAGTLPVC